MPLLRLYLIPDTRKKREASRRALNLRVHSGRIQKLKKKRIDDAYFAQLNEQKSATDAHEAKAKWYTAQLKRLKKKKK